MEINKDIEQEIAKRNITRLCHFVHTNKLLHILNSEDGIKAVDFIDQDILQKNDENRYDGKTDYVNCSVQYPNYWYFKRVKDNNTVFRDWAIVFIDPVVATFETSQFCPVNAATKYGAYIKKGYEAFKGMFESCITVGNRRSNRGIEMLRNAPTDDQAEVLIYKNIPRKYITGIALASEEIAKEKRAEWEMIGVNNIDIYVAPELFTRETSDKIRKGKQPVEHLLMEG